MDDQIYYDIKLYHCFHSCRLLIGKNVVKNKAVARLAKIMIQIFLLCFLLKIITSQNNYKYSI